MKSSITGLTFKNKIEVFWNIVFYLHNSEIVLIFQNIFIIKYYFCLDKNLN
jgi:hypothetical protein